MWFFIVHNNVPATQSLVGAWVKATGNSCSGISGNSRDSTMSKIPGGNSRELLSSWLKISGSFGILDFWLFLVVNCELRVSPSHRARTDEIISENFRQLTVVVWVADLIGRAGF